MSSALPLPHSDRRRFLKHFAMSTAVSLCGGKLWTARLLAEVDPSGSGRIPIKLSDYPALQNQFGSVRFTFADPSGGAYPFALNRATETDFYAVDTRCTHAGCIVEAYDGPQSAMVCFCHGSQYDITGQVIAGPAVNDLLRYNVTFDGLNTVSVLIPGLDMTIRNVAVQQQTSSAIRVRLDFPTLAFGRYRLHFRQSLSDPPQEILFATSPTAAPTLGEIFGNGQLQTVYAEAALPRGFFSVALVVDPY